MAREEERKFDVDPSFALPDLSTALPAGGLVRASEPVVLTATYYDTAQHHLARAGVSLRYRDGDQPPWTVKLPSDTPGIREEISRPGAPDAPPPELVALVTAYTRGRPVTPMVRLQTNRRGYDLCHRDGTVLAEVADDKVAGLGVTPFREIEVERRAGDPELLDRVGETLVTAGARTGVFTPKHVRALGTAAALAPDLVPAQPLGDPPRAGEVVTRSVRQAVARILAYDPPLRLRQTLPGGDTPVHQLRVASRRLRSDLRTFAALVEPEWAAGLRRELRWLARSLGAARDIEVQRQRLHDTATAGPAPPCDVDAVAHLDALLAERHAAALADIEEALASERYTALLEALVDAAAKPRLTLLGGVAAREMLPALVAGPVTALRYAVAGGDRAGATTGLAADATDERWHEVRVLSKRARYAVEAVTEVLGPPAPRLARRLAKLQNLLGEHQDAAVAAETWAALGTSAEATATPLLPLTAGRLYERERAAVRAARAKFATVWQRLDRPELLAWLP